MNAVSSAAAVTLSGVSSAVAVLVAIVVGLGGISATVWAVGKVKGLELTVDLLKSGNEALRAELVDGDRRHNDELARSEAARRASEAAAAERIARLEGHNAALLDGIADKLALAIGDRLEHAITAALAGLGATLTISHKDTTP